MTRSAGRAASRPRGPRRRRGARDAVRPTRGSAAIRAARRSAPRGCERSSSLVGSRLTGKQTVPILREPRGRSAGEAVGAMHDFDVAIVGGGVAGLTAALQLKDERPATSIVVFEKRAHPVPDSAYKVGESIAEVAATYMNRSEERRVGKECRSRWST